MPTSLPDDFHGTGKPRRDPIQPLLDRADAANAKPTFEEEHPFAEKFAMTVVGIIFGIIGIGFAVALAGALCWLGMWAFTHLPG